MPYDVLALRHPAELLTAARLLAHSVRQESTRAHENAYRNVLSAFNALVSRGTRVVGNELGRLFRPYDLALTRSSDQRTERARWDHALRSLDQLVWYLEMFVEKSSRRDPPSPARLVVESQELGPGKNETC